VTMAVGGGLMAGLGGILVEVESLLPKAALSYLEELRDRFGPTVPLDVRGAERNLGEISGIVRWLEPDAPALNIAGARASDRGHLLVLFAPVLPDEAAVRGLLQAFELDELVGFTQPRFSDAITDDIWFLPGGDAPSGGQLPRQSMSLLPESYLTIEQVAACVAIRREVAASFTLDPQGHVDLGATLLREMRNARRRGYRNLIVNRLVVPSTASRNAVYPQDGTASRLAGRVGSPHSHAADDWFNGTIHKRRELLVAKARRARPTEPIPVLLDCRGVVAHHNGTSEAIFGLLGGLAVEKPAWDIDLLFAPDAAAYHKVVSRFPAMRVNTTLPNRSFGAAICLNQPWNLSTVKELHDLALTIAFNILDTIAWDVVYLANPEVDKVWHFIADHADGLVYISTFTKDRFNFRFPVAPTVEETVAYLSLAAEEYRDARAVGRPEGDHILVFGNHYDHKAVAPTVDLLSRAFPFRTIQAVGAKSQPLHNVSVVQSGHLAADEIDRLIATARIVVFPSHYEGFGLPVVKALAYGRTVVVRRSSLWHEIAGLMHMPGQLVEFVTPHDLVEAVGKFFAGEQPTALQLGKDLVDSDRPPGWRQGARQLVRIVEKTLAGADAQRWCARDRSLALAQR
jgi:glycosyltransferase involved in cell wall biosynthesis